MGTLIQFMLIAVLWFAIGVGVGHEEVASLTRAAQNVSDGHWHERTYIQMRPLVRAMDDAIDKAAEMLGGDG